MDLQTLMTVKIIQQTAVLQHFFKKNPQTFQNLQYNNFSVPKNREFAAINMKKHISKSTSATEDSSSQEESIETSQENTCMQNQQFVHYSNILPAGEKKNRSYQYIDGYRLERIQR